MELIADVAVESALFHFDQLYSYRVPGKFAGRIIRGMRVLVPYGRANRRSREWCFIWRSVSRRTECASNRWRQCWTMSRFSTKRAFSWLST